MSDNGVRTQRPSPEALLKTAARDEGRGRLKIFLGAAPGVGKTYEMLLGGRARKREGVDVVVGIVETHGRAETAALTEGLEIVPRRRMVYREQTLEEMDLDAILARKPKLALIDEFAHTNAPDCRHPKRYLDVEELLAAGIDVYTTLNIQHVESLNDVVAQITRIRVRETVPDSVLDRADDIEVIDLSPDELLQRLREGKVYVPETAKRALDHYFSPGNLTALRELALRRTAQRVDAELLRHMQAHAIAGPWAAAERVMVCVSEDPRCPSLVRYAKRLADQLHAPWNALYIETARSHRLTREEQDRIAGCLRLVEQLGGESATIPGSGRIAEDVVSFARTNNVTQIVIGKSNRSRWFELLHGSVVHDLVRQAGAISVQVVAGEDIVREAPAKAGASGERKAPTDYRPYVVSMLAVAVALSVGVALRPYVGIESVDLVLLVAVIATAATYGLRPSLLAAVLGSLCYNFFFIQPLYTFTIADPRNVIALGFFLLVAVLVSNLAARVRTQMLTARNRARITEALYGFSRKLAAIATLDDLLWAAAHQIASALKLDVVFLLPEEGRLVVKSGYPPEDELDQADLGAAKWAFQNATAAGRGASTLTGAKRLFLPLRTGGGMIGVVGVTRAEAGPLFTPEERRLLDALMDQTAVAIERVGLAAEMSRARISAEAERLRSALFTSISHDLKTPLASIIGAASALRQYGKDYEPAARDELAGTIEAEAERLNRFVGNLLDMTRLEAGPVTLHPEPADLGELIGSALERTRHLLVEHMIEVLLAPDLPLVNLDVVLFEQALVNLLENAAKYAPKGTTVSMAAAREGRGVAIRVGDEGPGIPPEELERVFEKFHRLERDDRGAAGTGLGLAICRGFVEAMGGTVTAANRPDRPGAIFTIVFPAAAFAERPVAEAVA
jgi:two-component system sensor histidine kinase KdpD